MCQFMLSAIWSTDAVVYTHVRAGTCPCAHLRLLCAYACYSYTAKSVWNFVLCLQILLLWRCKEWNKLETIAFRSRFLPSVCVCVDTYLSLWLCFFVWLHVWYTSTYDAIVVNWIWPPVKRCSLQTIHPSPSIYLFQVCVHFIRVLQCNVPCWMYVC